MPIAAIKKVRDVLAAYPGLADIAVLAHEQESVGQVLVAYIVAGSPNLDLAELHKYARKELPGSMVPAAIMVVDAIPLASAGIAEPQALPAPDLRGLKPYRSPETPRQEALCTIFAEVLARPRCGVDDNFFTLGGESIDAMLIASRVSPVVGRDISMDDLFDAPTVAELDQLLEQLSSVKESRWLATGPRPATSRRSRPGSHGCREQCRPASSATTKVRGADARSIVGRGATGVRISSSAAGAPRLRAWSSPWTNRRSS